MARADAELIEALLDDVLDRSMLRDAVDAAIELLAGHQPQAQLQAIDAELATVLQERDRYVAAIATGGSLDSLVAALHVREQRRQALEARRTALTSQRRLNGSEANHVRAELLALADEWCRVLADVQRAGRM
jgi:hypothetical protein